MLLNQPQPFLDGVGFYSNLLELCSVFAFMGAALLAFLYLWRKKRLDMDEEAAITMLHADENEPVINKKMQKSKDVK